MGKSRINNDSDSKYVYNALDLVEISKYNFYRVLFLKYYRFIFHAMCSWDKSSFTLPGQLFKLAKFFVWAAVENDSIF